MLRVSTAIANSKCNFGTNGKGPHLLSRKPALKQKKVTFDGRSLGIVRESIIWIPGESLCE